MPNNKQIVRQLDILREFSTRKYGVTIRELAEGQGVSTRTIHRDLNDLQEAGFVLDAEVREGQKYWKFDQNTDLLSLKFPIDEIIALKFIEGIVSSLAGTPFNEAFNKTLNRIRTTLPEGHARVFSTGRHRLLSTPARAKGANPARNIRNGPSRHQRTQNLQRHLSRDHHRANQNLPHHALQIVVLSQWILPFVPQSELRRFAHPGRRTHSGARNHSATLWVSARSRHRRPRSTGIRHRP